MGCILHSRRVQLLHQAGVGIQISARAYHDATVIVSASSLQTQPTRITYAQAVSYCLDRQLRRN